MALFVIQSYEWSSQFSFADFSQIAFELLAIFYTMFVFSQIGKQLKIFFLESNL